MMKFICDALHWRHFCWHHHLHLYPGSGREFAFASCVATPLSNMVPLFGGSRVMHTLRHRMIVWCMYILPIKHAMEDQVSCKVDHIFLKDMVPILSFLLEQSLWLPPGMTHHPTNMSTTWDHFIQDVTRELTPPHWRSVDLTIFFV